SRASSAISIPGLRMFRRRRTGDANCIGSRCFGRPIPSRNLATRRDLPLHPMECAMEQEQRVAVVTGAGAGAGRAIAERFGREGWRVALLARSRPRLEAAKAAIEAKGGQALVLPTDMSDAKAVFAARDQVLQAWGRVDAWINAAMATVVGPMAEIKPDEFRRVTETTYLGYVYGS